ncbi:hypothetical protein TRFO_23940 [Tritrichomonas foetus]|uniref:PDEase domain-containing protein n=1 Tax=Tritrichomonas foetus TaxID=1144522 RepID=A0A1J4K9X1_9EUKA|nr:hypothetical protein TRFO_23940 [Tritrichomonas foetus]|eukprot:OHT07754.1 hypothetical protein TRFO_23940 [Tritrichomonas foetus]
MEFENIAFDSFEEENNDLLKFAINVFQDFDLLYYYQINCETIFNIIYHAREAYSSFVIYHNWAHAIDILHFVTFIGKQLYNRKKILKFDLLVLFLAALFQDAGHQGYTIHDTLDDDASNSIEIPRPNYNNSLNVDQSPENVNHCTLMMRLLSSHDSNPFKYMKSDDQKKAWKFLFKLVSATDPINHFSLIKKGNEMKEIH